MAGFYLLADEQDTLGPDNAFGFPSGQYEIGLAIQDRTFNVDGSLFYNAQLEDAFKGDTIVVNGKVAPFLNVDQGKYRFRILNGSQSREYIYRLENISDPGNDPSFILVGTDLGLIDAPIDLGNSVDNKIAPAERLDVIIDFAGMAPGDEIILRNDDPTLPLLPSIMKFIVSGQPGYTGAIATTLRTVEPMAEDSADPERYFRLKKDAGAACKDGSGRLVNEWLVESLDGPGGNVIGKYWDDLTDFPILGSREVWEFENPTNSMHPMHVHLVKFQILSKETLDGTPIELEPWEANTWKDIVRIPANTRARIIMDFDDYLGKFPQHCHLLDHEDHEMMRQFQTVNPAVPTCGDGNGTCDPGEDCVSCPEDCAQVGGDFCGNGLCEAGDGENCISCPEDCAGKQSGAEAKQFCCGAPGGTGDIGCGVDATDNRCIDASASLFCRVTARVSACCGDKLCEGAETVSSCFIDCDPVAGACTPTEPNTEYSCSDGKDNDCDQLFDSDDPDCLDTDGDGLPNITEDINGNGTVDEGETDPNKVDTDKDGLVDGNSGVVLVDHYPNDPNDPDDYPDPVDADDDGFVDGEQTLGTDPTKYDSDGDLLDDGLEVANSADPLDPGDWPNLKDGDCGPYGEPDEQLNAGDLVVSIRIALGELQPRALELAHCDLGTPDGDIDVADVLLMMQMLQSLSLPGEI
jgi:FtsP/CotA-like multicopper oxidase with cupredoxin domain